MVKVTFVYKVPFAGKLLRVKVSILSLRSISLPTSVMVMKESSSPPVTSTESASGELASKIVASPSPVTVNVSGPLWYSTCTCKRAVSSPDVFTPPSGVLSITVE